ncbi:Branched-chain amino acid transport protein (AzlD) [Sphaerochaeta pleomorpha str. Grapes]|uniref:Branched-chain amino acid transport protein (AzlD) n=1 Tax=Sphaerochaeta pleomorpha (strain ATCC BAA-1885 / DSM 22778 / Grapes) TaxID=158190 RepID=G8QYN2_SPHPG|nr:AzlD domain-containing protein [Sphaerochaeta pleomorpha]AEV28595.1 Branched-chain amino acid transport protein (AzlD) [Sphaerochaeta pleomorpha str. Grapes]
MRNGIPLCIYILVTALATFLVRALPYYANFLDRLPKFLAKCLRLLPIAALGALIFPGVITDFQGRWYAGLLGIGIAFLLSYFKRGMIFPILFSVLITYLALVL